MSGSVTVPNSKDSKNTYFWQKSLFRQIFIVSLAWNTYMLTGLTVGTSTVAIPQMRKEGIPISPEISAWFSSIIGYGSIPWLAAPLLTQRIGFRKTYLIVYIFVFIGALNNYLCNSAIHFLIGQALSAASFGVAINISTLMITDYASPKYRGICLTLKSATVYWGIWVANTIGTFFYWRFTTLTIMVLSLYGVFLLFIPESPYWLASKGMLKKCEDSFRWIRGVDEESEKELKAILSADYKNKTQNKRIGNMKDIVNPEFYKPFLICCVLELFYYFCGKFACSVYALEMLKKMTATDHAAYEAMLAMDGLTIIGLYIGCFISKRLKRRTMLFVFSSLGAIFLFILSLYLYLVKLSVIVENQIISLVLLSLFSLLISCGPMILTTTVVGELIPLKFRSLFTTLISIFTYVVFGLSLQIAPYIFDSGLHVAFFTYGVLSTLFIFILYFYLPETKGKTLVELSNIFKKDISSKLDDVEADKLMK